MGGTQRADGFIREPQNQTMAVLAVVQSVHGASIRLTHERWSHIVESHDYMAGQMERVLETLTDPDCLANGVRDERLALKYYPTTLLGPKHSVVVYHEAEQEGFVVTAFMTSKAEKLIKRGLQWQKSSTS